MTSVTIEKEFIFMTVFGLSVIYLMIKTIRKHHHPDKASASKDMIRIAAALYVSVLVGVTLFPIVIPPYAQPYQMEFVNWNIAEMFNYGGIQS